MLGRGTEEGSSNEQALISLRRPGRRPRLFFNYISTAVFYIFVFPYSNVAYEKRRKKKRKANDEHAFNQETQNSATQEAVMD